MPPTAQFPAAKGNFNFAIEEVSTPMLDVEKDSSSEDAVDKCPDGGLKAWLVVLGLAAGSCTSFGLVQAWGVFQAYYTETLLADTSPSNIAWIGSIQYSFGFMPGILFGRLFDMGYLRLPMLSASALLVAATIATGQCTTYWQFLLCQGIATGIASGILFTAIMGTYAHWFDKRLGLAYAVGSFGSSMGGTIFPIVIRNLLQHRSFQWTMRVTGCIVFGFLVICNLTIARRLPPKNHQGPFFRLEEFRSPAYCAYTAAAGQSAGIVAAGCFQWNKRSHSPSSGSYSQCAVFMAAISYNQLLDLRTTEDALSGDVTS
ncbi:hypothetical protein NM688_g2902 [Phlebia brevispora]|uniref:Uncharacterized protein n=1 Tax=Phlebia brevispora TaxID=194682 RepID=A0ACC1T769_9APHY|nr:hypothetical protein NM688_g2902 [Phlebia brevispora]